MIDAPGLREKCQEAGIGDIILYLGGNTLVVDPAGEWKWEDIERKFKDMGYTRVYGQGASIKQIVNGLKADLKVKMNHVEA